MDRLYNGLKPFLKPFFECGVVVGSASAGAILISKLICDDEDITETVTVKNESYTNQIDNIIDYNIDLLKSIQWLNLKCCTRQDKKKFDEFEKKLAKLIKLEQNLEKLKTYNKAWFLLGFEYKHQLNNILMYFQGRFFNEKSKKYFEFLRNTIGDLAHNIQLENIKDLESRIYNL